MMNFPMYSFENDSLKPEYTNLTKQEKETLSFIEQCLQSENIKIRNASFKMMNLLTKLSENTDIYQPEEVNDELNSIKENLNEKEIQIINDFMLARISSMGVYSGKDIQERRLIKERKGKYDKSK